MSPILAEVTGTKEGREERNIFLLFLSYCFESNDLRPRIPCQNKGSKERRTFVICVG